MFEVSLRFRCGLRRSGAVTDMTGWIQREMDRVAGAIDEEYQSHALRLARIDQLKVVFPEWVSEFATEIEGFAAELRTGFPDNPRYHYRVEPTPQGCIVIQDGPRFESTEVEFSFETRLVNFRIATKPDVRGKTMKAGDLKVSNEEKAFVVYTAFVRVENGKQRSKKIDYFDPKAFASDVMQEIAGL